MLEVYQKHTFIEIDTNLRKFSAIFSNMVCKENAYYWENEKKFFLHAGAGTSKISGTKFQINRLHTTFKANGDLNCYQNIMHVYAFSQNYYEKN